MILLTEKELAVLIQDTAIHFTSNPFLYDGNDLDKVNDYVKTAKNVYSAIGTFNADAYDDENNILLRKAVETLDDYLNAGCKEERKQASTKAKEIYKEFYGTEYKNRNEKNN